MKIKKCEHCGERHKITCPRIKAIEYNSVGCISKVEFHALVGKKAKGSKSASKAVSA